MAVCRLVVTRSAINVALGVCFGMTLAVLVIEIRGPAFFGLQSSANIVNWRDEIRTYIAERNWTEVDDFRAKRIGKTVKLTCIIITPAENFNQTYTTLYQTWAKRCDHVVYFSNVLPLLKDVVKVNSPDDLQEVDMSAQVLFDSLDYIYKHRFTNADWFLKVVPQTYIIVENLKQFLSDKDPDHPVYYGQKFSRWGLTFPSGYGYVMSREAMRRIATHRAITAECRESKEEEAAAFARCCGLIGVRFGNSLDSKNRSLFHTASVEDIAMHEYNVWYLQYVNVNTTISGTSSISPSAISLAPYGLDSMFALEYYIYHSRQYGVVPWGFS